MDDDKLLYKVPHVAELLETSRSKTYELVASGEIPSIRLGGSIRVPAQALRDWIAKKSTRK